MSALKGIFGLSSFRKNQLEAINATLDGKDVFVLMPTGGGKSLCYQLPATCQTGKTQGVTFVFSPLIALISEQVASLRSKQIDAHNLGSAITSTEDAREAARRLRSSAKPSIVYITPEKLKESAQVQEILTDLYEAKLLARFVIDEAHVIASWGRDFRDAYTELNVLRERYPDVPIMALTATANQSAIQDIINSLSLRDPVCLTQSFNRSNLHYKVCDKPSTKKKSIEAVAAYIRSQHHNDTGIVYCFSRNDCEEVALRLREDYNLPARHYHAGMDPKERELNQVDWLNGKYNIIVATIAFGMGIDKPDVRFVIHHTMPKSLDGFYQETGRAGRDGEAADCVLFYAYKDSISLRNMICSDRDRDKSLPPAEKKRLQEELQAVTRYCTNNVDCRRSLVLDHFGEKFDPANCHNSCDNCCRGGVTMEKDLTDETLKIIALFNEMSAITENFTLNHFKDVYRGRNNLKIRDAGHEKLKSYASGAQLSPEMTNRLMSEITTLNIFCIKRVPVGKWTQEYVQACLAGTLRIILKFKDEGPPKGKAPAAAKGRGSKNGKQKAPEAESFLSLYRDDDGRDEISDFDDMDVSGFVMEQPVTGAAINEDLTQSLFNELKKLRDNVDISY
ncbi:P-loop containing nucleoside triphosphate hydrolase protein [Hygrophoropsis aurantiaca]|uniref:P-loop containing nucleoside triphosphate hydrolase protein n=1 Tax=Hygrophoropsis aurantiaca TaxID=72124 RepID=A0ACB8ALW0_9AGAM|nr:P-loop containing nucleoside triphosphate hydrolase protein [Hygrophoropsis aurantiaca]